MQHDDNPQVLQVSPYKVYPPTSGGTKRISGLVSSFGDSNVTRFAFSDFFTETNKIEISEGVSEFRKPSLQYSVLSCSLDLFDLPPISPRFAYYGQLNDLIRASDIILVEHPWLFSYIKGYASDDALLVYSSHNVEYIRMDGNLIVEKLIKQVERNAVLNSDYTIVTSQTDKETYIREFGGETAIDIVPNGSTISQRTTKYTGNPINILFVGSSYQPNIEAVDNIFNIAENIRDSGIRFHVVGSVCHHFTEKDAPSNVTLHGFVENLEEIYLDTQIAINPIMSGSGSNVKVPEYFSYGIPVVTTKFGSRGIPADANKHFLIEDLDGFEEALTQLSEDEEKRREIGLNARNLVKNNLNWQYISEKLFETLLGMYYNK